MYLPCTLHILPRRPVGQTLIDYSGMGVSDENTSILHSGASGKRKGDKEDSSFDSVTRNVDNVRRVPTRHIFEGCQHNGGDDNKPKEKESKGEVDLSSIEGMTGKASTSHMNRLKNSHLGSTWTPRARPSASDKSSLGRTGRGGRGMRMSRGAYFARGTSFVQKQMPGQMQK